MTPQEAVKKIELMKQEQKIDIPAVPGIPAMEETASANTGVPADNEKQIAEALARLHFIDRVGWAGRIEDEDIPDSVYKEYTRALLGGVPFKYSFPLFDGKVIITFNEATWETLSIYSELVERLKSAESDVCSKLAILTFLVEVKRDSNKSVIVEAPTKELLDIKSDEELEKAVIALYNTQLRELPGALHKVLPSLWFAFNALLKLIIKKGLPVSF